MDPIANMLTSLINAQRAQKKRVSVPHSNFKQALLDALQALGCIASYRVQEGPMPKIVVTLAYNEDGSPKINGIKRLSTPGQRRYSTAAKLPYDYAGFGKVIISTSQGLMDADKARKEKIGGELVCAVW